MKQTPATISPFHPARTSPMWIASSVEFGPGMKLTADTMSRKCWRSSQRRRVTTSSSMSAICAAGPPNAVNPSFKKSRATSPSRARSPAALSGDSATRATLRPPPSRVKAIVSAVRSPPDYPEFRASILVLLQYLELLRHRLRDGLALFVAGGRAVEEDFAIGGREGPFVGCLSVFQTRPKQR